MTSIRRLACSAIATLVLATGAAPSNAAQITPAARHDVDQLLSRLASSNCKFNRNGSWYSASEARAHLEHKYQYALDKNLLASAEDFIRVVGTKSSSTDRSYSVQCGNAPAQPSAAWLGAQLSELRTPVAPPAAAPGKPAH
ncbi:MAG: DUF5329 family protein [Pseudomonadota bacterium]